MRYAHVQCLLLASVLVLSLTAQAGTHDCCCTHCGRVGGCQKICRLVCEEKKVEIVCWGCKSEEFCLPEPSLPDCQFCEMVCGNCNEPRTLEAVHGKSKKFVWNTWIPGCAELHTRKKLMKKTITKTVPSYKWVVEDLCPECVACCERASVKPGSQLPPVPVESAQVIYGEIAALPTQTSHATK